jgi:hypothetical protein
VHRDHKEQLDVMVQKGRKVIWVQQASLVQMVKWAHKVMWVHRVIWVQQDLQEQMAKWVLKAT